MLNVIIITNSNQLELRTNKLYYLTTKSAAKTSKNTVGSPEIFFHMTLGNTNHNIFEHRNMQNKNQCGERGGEKVYQDSTEAYIVKSNS